MICLEHVTRRFDNLLAVDSISFSVAAGETFGLLGPNGAGKSTTINMIIGALRPDSGSITVAGEQDTTRAAARMKIGAAPQSLALYDELTAEENLRFFGSLYGLSGKRLSDKVGWALDFSGLQSRKDDLVKTYSGGMQRRLNLVSGLLHDPQVILMDEPTVGIDPQSRNQIFESIELLRSQGRTIIYTTHYMEEAQRLCDRVAIIDRGKLLAIDTVDGLISTYGGQIKVEVTFAQLPPAELRIPGEWEGTTVRTESLSMGSRNRVHRRTHCRQATTWLRQFTSPARALDQTVWRFSRRLQVRACWDLEYLGTEREYSATPIQ